MHGVVLFQTRLKMVLFFNSCFMGFQMLVCQFLKCEKWLNHWLNMYTWNREMANRLTKRVHREQRNGQHIG